MQEEMQRADRQARWLLWQTQGVAVDGAQPAAAEAPAPPAQPEIRRSRYDAVIRRMQQAGQRTGTYTPWA